MTHIRPIIKHKYKFAKTRSLMENQSERRFARRFCFGWEVRIRGIGLAGLNFDERVELKNLSSSGVLLQLTKSMKLGTKLEVWLKTPFKKNNWIIYSGKTVRIQSTMRIVGVAVRFNTSQPRFGSVVAPCS